MKIGYYFILNLLLAIIWIILNREADIFQFLLGFTMGFFILWIFQIPLRATLYIRRMKGLVKFVFSFAWIFIRSNLTVAKIILFTPKNKINPSFISYPAHDISHFEALLISQFINLTPGSITVSLRKKDLIVHLLNLKDKNQAKQSIDELKSLILGFTR